MDGMHAMWCASNGAYLHRSNLAVGLSQQRVEHVIRHACRGMMGGVSRDVVVHLQSLGVFWKQGLGLP